MLFLFLFNYEAANLSNNVFRLTKKEKKGKKTVCKDGVTPSLQGKFFQNCQQKGAIFLKTTI